MKQSRTAAAICAVLTVAMTTPLHAQADTPAQDAAAKTEPQEAADMTAFMPILPNELERELKYMRSDTGRALETYVSLAFSISTDGQVTPRGVQMYLDGVDAARRAEFAKGVLCYDLNADGLVQVNELQDSLARLSSISRKTRLMTLATQADSDGDGALTLPEIYAYADRDASNNNRWERRLGTLMTMDIDLNGTITGDEIAAYVNMAANLTDAEMGQLLAGASTAKPAQ